MSVISQKAHREIGSPKLYHPQRILRGPSNYALPVKGQLMGKLLKGDREVKQELYVVENLCKQLLGCPAVEALELAVRIEAVGERRSPIDQFPTLFQGLGKLEGEYLIKLQEGANPFALTVPRRVAIPLMKQVKDEIERMEQLGVIVRVSEPSGAQEW